MTNKTLAILSYVTIIGWLVSFFSSKDQTPRSSLVVYHLKQGFGLFVVEIILNIGLTVVASIIPALGFLGLVSWVLSLIFMILGIINANNEQEKPIPVIGKMFENKFSFIS